MVVVNPSASQLIEARDELIMMRPTAIGQHKYQGSPVPVATATIGFPPLSIHTPIHSAAFLAGIYTMPAVVSAPAFFDPPRPVYLLQARSRYQSVQSRPVPLALL